ncbi:MAG: DUF2442 domain-containing protein [Bacteroidales bacterium]|jgi:hypothetical protein|nr:DUF2442 domain-containing protein [Bacteroidales bacterium]
MIIKVTEAQYIDAYKMWVRFNNGDCRIFDFATIIDKYPVFEPLKDIELLRNFQVSDTLEWLDGEIVIAPEYLQEHGVVAYPNKEIELGSVAEDKNTYIQDPEIMEIANSYADVKQGKTKTNSISKLLDEL